MKLEAKVNFDRFEEALQVVDAHTAGEFCRMVIGGFPEPEGSTMIEKKKMDGGKIRPRSYSVNAGAERTSRYVRCFPLRADPRRSRSWGNLHGYRRIPEHVRTLYDRSCYSSP